MKVLMLGWECPPNISGGLGVACHGLTEALAADGVRVIFVTQSNSGSPDQPGIQFIAASDVDLSNEAPASVENHTSERNVTTRTTQLQSKTQIVTKQNELSSLSPYDMPHVDINTSIQQWNEPLFRDNSHTVKTTEPRYSAKNTSKQKLKGGYGPGLYDEVNVYSKAVEQLAGELEFDVIHAHDWITFSAGARAKKISGKPLVVHFHATEFDRAGDSGSTEVYKIERSAIEESDRIVAVSNLTGRVLTSKYNAPASKLHVVHNGIRPNEQSVARKMSPLGDKIVTFLGRVTFQKGPEYFVSAAKKVIERFPDCHFVMAGSGDALPRMITMVAANGMSSQFHFTGFLNGEEMKELLSMSSAYVMPSVSEPFGITPLEAVQAGVPVIISKQSGVSEVIDDVLKVDFWNVDELADAICNVIAHKSLANTLRTNAKETIRDISWQTAATKIKHIYYETVAQPQHTSGSVFPGTSAPKTEQDEIPGHRQAWRTV